MAAHACGSNRNAPQRPSDLQIANFHPPAVASISPAHAARHCAFDPSPCHAHAPLVKALAVAVAPLPPSARRPRPPDALHWNRGMNTSLTAYTHLESLLLFQSLHAYGLEPQVFSRISELLKTNPHITADKRFQSGRLSPDALRNFYLHNLKEELRLEQAYADGDAPNGPDAKASRKRKAPSPSLPTVTESLQHQHLIPKLVNKLYARYRQAIIEQIRQDEDQYERLQRELHGIERGDWDEELKQRANGKSASRSPTLPRRSSLLPQQHQVQSPSNSSALPVLAETNRVDGPPLAPSPSAPFHPNLAPAQSPLAPNGQVPHKTVKKKAPLEHPGTPLTPHPHIPIDQASQPPHTPRNAQTHPIQHGPPQANTPYNGPSVNQSPFQQAHTGSQYHPPQGYPPHMQAGHPHSAQFQPTVPMHGAKGVAQLASNSRDTQSPHDSPANPRLSGPHQPGLQSSGLQTPQQPRFVPVPGQPPYLPPHHHSGQPPPQGGFMLPPFQVAPQDPSSRVHQTPVAGTPQHPVTTPVSNRQSSAKGVSHPGKPGVPPMHPLNTQSSTFSSPLGIRAILSALSTPSTPKTAWKESARSQGNTPVPRPDMSPIDDLELPNQKDDESPPRMKSTRKSRAKGKAKQKDPEPDPEPEPEPQVESDHEVEETVPEMETRQGRPRRKVPVKKGRPGSIASSQAGTSVRGRSRSHSILSHTETVAADNESQAGGRIKSERAASIDNTEDEIAPTPTHMSTRRRGAAVQQSNKRKRGLREVSPEESEGRADTPGLPKTITALRHFSRMCAPLMNDIGSHKHASTFTTAVKAKDAEGYYEIIKRPTDLKTIQKAIAAGAKQVAAAASGDTPSGSPGGAGGIVELPVTPDNMPPKAIVNSSQLEKELMRMFVNAVMFNSGEDGVVEDARDMFETVQQSVSNWRSVERGSGKLEVEETPPVLDEEVPTLSKRRKL